VRSQVESLTDMQEARFPDPWQVSDAPEDFVSKMIAALVGIELHVTRLIGKTKASQNQPPANRAGVVEGLGKTGSELDRAMARLVAGD
jgi:transcriptional regulator